PRHAGLSQATDEGRSSSLLGVLQCFGEERRTLLSPELRLKDAIRPSRDKQRGEDQEKRNKIGPRVSKSHQLTRAIDHAIATDADRNLLRSAIAPELVAFQKYWQAP